MLMDERQYIRRSVIVVHNELTLSFSGANLAPSSLVIQFLQAASFRLNSPSLDISSNAVRDDDAKVLNEWGRPITLTDGAKAKTTLLLSMKDIVLILEKRMMECNLSTL